MAKSTGQAIGAPGGAMKDWEAESDLRTLIDAEKIKADPDRLKRAMAKKKELQKALKGMEE
jgi:hypothetical protein